MTSVTVETFMVESDHYQPINPLNGTATVKVLTGDTIYYADQPYVTATTNQGSLTVGQSHTFTIPAWLRSATLSSVSVTITGPPDEETADPAVSFLSVLDYGADPTLADNMAKINAAEAAAAAAGRALYFPGVFKCTGQVVLGAGFRHWFGAGEQISGLTFTVDGGTHGSQYAINTDACSSYTWRDMGFTGPGSIQTSTVSGASQDLNDGSLTLASATGFQPSGTLNVPLAAGGTRNVAYTSITSSTFNGITGIGLTAGLLATNGGTVSQWMGSIWNANLSCMKTKVSAQHIRCSFAWFYDGTSINSNHEFFDACWWGNNYNNRRYLPSPATKGNQHFVACISNPCSFAGDYVEASNSIEGSEFAACHWFGNPYPIYGKAGRDLLQAFMLGNKFDRCAFESPGNAYIYVEDATGFFGYNILDDLDCGSGVTNALNPLYNIPSQPNDYIVKLGSVNKLQIRGNQSTFYGRALGTSVTSPNGGCVRMGGTTQDLEWEMADYALDKAHAGGVSLVSSPAVSGGIANSGGEYHNQRFAFTSWVSGSQFLQGDLVSNYDFYGAAWAPTGADIGSKGVTSYPQTAIVLATCPAVIGETTAVLLPGGKASANTLAADGAITNLQWLAADQSSEGNVKTARLGSDTIIGWAMQQSKSGKVDMFLLPAAPTMGGASCVAVASSARSGLLTIDSYTLVDGDRVLLTGQSTGSQNGLWVAHSGAWTRPYDYGTAQLAGSRSVAIRGGTVYSGSSWTLTTTGTVTVDTTSTTWTQTGRLAGAGLTLTGNTLAVDSALAGTGLKFTSGVLSVNSGVDDNGQAGVYVIPPFAAVSTGVTLAANNLRAIRVCPRRAISLVSVAFDIVTAAAYASTPAAPTVAINATAGNLNGAYLYKITFVTASGETAGGTTSASVSPANQQVNLTVIPTGGTGTTARKVYRTAAGGADATQKLVATIADNSTTTYTDNIADGSLGAAVPTSSTAANDPIDVAVLSSAGSRLASNGGQTGVVSPGTGVQTCSLSYTLVAGTVYYIAVAYGTVGGTAAIFRNVAMNSADASLGSMFGATVGKLEMLQGTSSYPIGSGPSVGVGSNAPVMALRES